MPHNLTYKIASEPWEFEQIHRLNYRTFVEEIPLHVSNAVTTAGGQVRCSWTQRKVSGQVRGEGFC
jgi:hypothetical protein